MSKITVKEALLSTLEHAKQHKNEWVPVKDDVSHYSIKTCSTSGKRTSSTFFINDGDKVKIVVLLNNDIGISINFNYFSFSEEFKVVDMFDNSFTLTAKE